MTFKQIFKNIINSFIMVKKDQIQRPGLRKKYFGSKGFLRKISKNIKINEKPKKATFG